MFEEMAGAIGIELIQDREQRTVVEQNIIRMNM